MTVKAQVQRRLALAWMWLSLLLLGIVLLSGCGPRHADVDPMRAFHYGQLQLEESTGLLVLDVATLEYNGEDHGLLIDELVPDDRKVCFEFSNIKGAHEERCTSLGELRALVRR